MFLEVMGILFCVLLAFTLIGGWGQMIEDTYHDRKGLQGARLAKATRKWLFVIFFPIIWPIALVVWLVKQVFRGGVAFGNVIKELQIGKKP